MGGVLGEKVSESEAVEVEEGGGVARSYVDWELDLLQLPSKSNIFSVFVFVVESSIPLSIVMSFEISPCMLRESVLSVRLSDRPR